MCGIVGYIGERPASPILLDCLKRLEYRGYDSAGIALMPTRGELTVTRAPGRLAALEQRLNGYNGAAGGRLGIGHTRWATHGRPTEHNAHPHSSPDGKIVVVHNGIFENYAELRSELTTLGIKFKSETDTECFPLLVWYLMSTGLDLEAAFRAAVRRLEGIYAIACIHADHPDRVLVARSGPPLVIGVGSQEHFIASDVTPLLGYTRDVLFLEDGDLAEIGPGGVRIFDVEGNRRERSAQHIDWDATSAELGQYTTYMQKEIFEQSAAVASTLEGRLPEADEPMPLDLALAEQELEACERIVILACGTSLHAGLVGKFLIELLAGIPVEVDHASEYRYRSPIVTPHTLAVAITQSGETADTLAAMKEARARGARTIAICNVHGSQATRQADATLLTRAGPEIGVASTKAFTTQLVTLALLALRLAEAKQRLTPSMRAELVLGLRALPAQLERMRALEPQLVALAERYQGAAHALYLGRGPLYPIALEGALKLKEISYIHAEGYPAGEMKHGPIALIDEQMPIVALMPSDNHRERTLSNLQEAAARDGQIIAFVTEGDRALEGLAKSVVELPPIHPLLAPVVYVVPLQLFAYHVARLRGCDVDKPRNLAKSVTVE
jgi:glucosamine--fructose-6-phosphate aminotransferase (isomerizing)